VVVVAGSGLARYTEIALPLDKKHVRSAWATRYEVLAPLCKGVQGSRANFARAERPIRTT